jgi:hypothetical protein
MLFVCFVEPLEEKILMKLRIEKEKELKTFKALVPLGELTS